MKLFGLKLLAIFTVIISLVVAATQGPAIGAVMLFGFCASIPILMNGASLCAAATASIDTPERDGRFLRNLPIAASTKLYAGTLVARDASGNMVSASDTASLIVLGRLEPNPDGVSGDYDNSAGSAGDVKCVVKRGVFKFTNSSGDAITAAEVGKVCFVEDNQTVNKSGGTNKIKAGRVMDIDADGGIWVDVGSKADIAYTLTSATTANATDLSTSEALANALKVDLIALAAQLRQ